MRVLLSTVLFSTLALAQVDTGTISGVVTDSTGAVIPGVRVQITHQNTNTEFNLTTNGSGFYAAPTLRPGPYFITVTMEGFRGEKRTGIELRVQDRIELNFQLTVGAAATEITISAAAPLLESETSSLGQVVEEKSISNLPLNGRNFIQLATLTAGTLPSSRTAERDSFISNGARGVQNSYLLDGIDNRNRILGFDKSSAQIIQPVIDGIQEFKVQTATFSAEFGQAAGGVVNVTMKSGTNDLHGNVFEFLRNSEMDAKPYFQTTGPKPLFIQNQFGATLGGRVVKDRTFFFGSWQSSREVNAAPQIGSVPTASMRQGIFPGRVTDPTNGKTPFPNNTIPASRWDPVSAKLLPLYPSENIQGPSAGVRNFTYNPKERLKADGYNLRIDHRLGSRDSMFGRISQGWNDNRLPTTLPEPANQSGVTELTARQIMFSETHTVSSNKVNEFRIGFVYTGEDQDILTERLFEQYGIKGTVEAPRIKGLPQFTINGLSTLGTAGPGVAPIAATGSGNFPLEKSGKVWQLMDNFSWVKSRHTVKFGIDFSRVTMFAYATNSARPNFNFNSTYTGVGLGDFLLGFINTTAISQQQLDTLRQNIYNGYVQDDWKVSTKLTLNFGLRYELPTPFWEHLDRMSNFVLESGPCHYQIILVSDKERCGVGRSLTNTDRNNFAPRVGLAYQIARKTVLRSGFGVFYGRDENYGVAGRLTNNTPFVSAASFAGDQNNPAFLLKDGFPANALSRASGSLNVINFPFNFMTPYVQQWNFNVQQDLGHSLIAQVSYTGSGAHKLYSLWNYNQAFPGTGNVNARRPIQGYATINSYNPFVNSSYHALLGKLERRYSNGISLLTSYTYGHSIDGGGNPNDQSDPALQDARNPRGNKGSSNFDVRHRFVVSGLYQLPFGKSNSPLSQFTRNWQISGIISAQTGNPFTVTSNTDPTGTAITARPDRLRDGTLPSDQRSPTHWFDNTAFATPTCTCFGNSGRQILRAPGFQNVDIGVSRDFVFHERYRVHFRGEAFNLFNHPNFGLPNASIGSPAVGIIGTTVNPERQMQVALKFFF
ncbi:MAG: TonB-dependent receptor [Acidobacteria bacterium]|nr:TonB-dependent receptor [Acidobacteriota bacterium]